jgi:HEAT repeat protein
MLATALADKSFAVRAEALAGLQDVELDAKILGLLAPAISDPNPVVRLRVAEALGVSGLDARTDVLKFLANDSNPWVSLAARAMQEQEKK